MAHVTAALSDGGDPHEIPIDDGSSLAALFDAVHSTLNLPLPASEYEVILLDPSGDGGEGGVNLTEAAAPESLLHDVGVMGCGERVEVRVHFRSVARTKLRDAGVTTAADAARVAREAADARGDILYVIAASEIMEEGALQDVLAPWVCSAAQANDAEAVLWYLRGGGSPSVRDPATRLTPLVGAARQGHEDMVALLLSKGADANVRGDQRVTALHEAAARGSAAMTAALCAHGADVSLTDMYGCTPLLTAVKGEHRDVVALLLATGRAAVYLPDRLGRTPLSWAAVQKRVEIAAMLLAHGAHPDAQDHNRQSPLWWAARYKRRPMLKLLRAAMHKDGQAGVEAEGGNSTPQA